MLRGLGLDEARAILREQGSIEVDCEFCNAHYAFDAVDVERLFAAAEQPRSPSTRH
jgi:molecular chaperone Hsp33